MIYVDSCIPMYLIGAEHPHKVRVIEMVSRFVEGGDILATSAEAFQEIIHRYGALKDDKHLNAAYEALEEMAQTVFEVRKTDVDAARDLKFRYPPLSSRDCLHVAIMKRTKCTAIWTFDEGFDQVPSLQRLA